MGRQIKHRPTSSVLQLCLRSVFLVIVIESVFFGFIGAGMYAGGFYFLMGVAAGLMIIDVALGRSNRNWAIGLLAVAFGFAALSVALTKLRLPHAPDLGSQFGILVVGPVLMVLGVIVLALSSKKLYWIGVIGFIGWMAGACIANLLAIADAIASV